MPKTNEEAVAGCLQCPAHPAVLESIKNNTTAIRWFIGTFLVVTIGCLIIFWTSYIKSSEVDRKFEVYVSGQSQRLINIERCIEDNRRVLNRIDDNLRENNKPRDKSI